MLKDLTGQKKIDPQVVLDAIKSLRDKGWDINPYTVADEAKIPRSTLYRSPELMDLVSQARGGGPAGAASEEMVKRIAGLEQTNQDLQHALAENDQVRRSLEREVAQVRQRFEELENQLAEVVAETQLLQEQLVESRRRTAVPAAGTEEGETEYAAAAPEGPAAPAEESAYGISGGGTAGARPAEHEANEMPPRASDGMEGAPPYEPKLSGAQESEELSAAERVDSGGATGRRSDYKKYDDELEDQSMPTPPPAAAHAEADDWESERVPDQELDWEESAAVSAGEFSPASYRREGESEEAGPTDSSGLPVEQEASAGADFWAAPPTEPYASEIHDQASLEDDLIEPVDMPVDDLFEPGSSIGSDYDQEQSPTAAERLAEPSGEAAEAGLPGEETSSRPVKSTTLSEDELRDLLKHRFGRAGEEATAPKEEEPARKGSGTRFVGGNRAPQEPPPQGFVIRTVPPDIRKACLVLGLRPEELTFDTVHIAWKKEMTTEHPDSGGDTEIAVYLNTAKDTLYRFLEAQAPKLGKKFGGGTTQFRRMPEKPEDEKAQEDDG